MRWEWDAVVLVANVSLLRILNSTWGAGVNWHEEETDAFLAVFEFFGTEYVRAFTSERKMRG